MSLSPSSRGHEPYRDVTEAVETTPLLAGGSRSGSGDNGATSAAAADGSQAPTAANSDRGGSRTPKAGSEDDGSDGDEEEDDEEEEDKPLPTAQILLLCYARLVEPIAFFSIFPYINPMVQQLGHLPVDSVGFYSGLIESLFSLTQMLVMLLWGRLSDRWGRKPVLVSSLVGVSASVAIFGLATSVWQMALFRCLAGVFAGTIVTIRTMISEHSSRATQARAFSWFAFSGNLGIFLGPLLGGALADPVRQYPRFFGGSGIFFERYPYALSGFVVACVGLSAAATSAFFVEETLERKVVAAKAAAGSNDGNDDDNDNPSPQPTSDTTTDPESSSPTPTSSNPSTLSLLRSPGIPSVLYNYAHVMVLAYGYTAIVPVFWYTPVARGGYGFSPLQISLFMGLMGASQAAWLLLAFPPLQRRWGTNGVMRACSSAYPFFFLVFPLLGLLLRRAENLSSSDGDDPAEQQQHRGHALRVTFYVLSTTLLALGVGVSMSFTAVQLALNDACPRPRAQALATLNALALTGASGLRAACPWAFSSLFAAGVRRGLLSGYLAWLVLAVLAAGFTVSTRSLPASSEKDGGGGGGGKGKGKNKKTKKKKKERDDGDGGETRREGGGGGGK